MKQTDFSDEEIAEAISLREKECQFELSHVHSKQTDGQNE